MINKIKALFTQDFLATLFNYVCKYGLRVLLIIFIPLYLDDVTKGYWFTFGSVAALSMIADMGFTSILTQFAAHEFSYFTFRKDCRKVDVQDVSLDKIAGLFKFALKWSLSVTVGLSILICVVGAVLFGGKHDNINWIWPWIIYVVATGLNFFVTACHAFFEGCSCISLCQRIKLGAATLNSVLSLVMLFLGCGLYSLSIPLLASEFLSLYLLYNSFRYFIKQLNQTETSNIREWVKPVVNLLWRYALSWISGYIIYQIYTPWTFAKYGAEVSGKVGYTLTIVSAIVSVAGIWNYISIPKINGLVEKKQWVQLDKYFKKNILLIESSFLFFIAAFCVMLLIPFTAGFINKYVLVGVPITCLFIGYAFQLATAHIAVYLRAHNEEPLMYSSIVTAIIALSVTYFTVNYLDYTFVFLGFCVSTSFVFPWVCHIFNQRRLYFHK